MTEQLTFDWPDGVALGAQDFFVSDANRHAFAQVIAAVWPLDKLVIIGPEGAGKSHLARVFAQAHDAVILQASDLTDAVALIDQAVVIEDIDRLPADAEEAVFHLHNHLHHSGHLLLMTARTAPSRWQIALPDLASRMQAALVTPVADPDDDLLAALIMKLFADRQIMPKPALVNYLVPRIERSFAAAAQIVDQLDAAAFRLGKPVGQKLAALVLDNGDRDAR